MRRAIALATLIATLVLIPAAQGATPRSFYGVIPNGDPDTAQIARMGAGDVGTLRINLAWGQVQSGPNAPLDRSHYDAIIGQAAENGIRILPTIYSTPLWAAPKVNYPPPQAYIGQYRNFVREAAARYGNNGIFWTLHPLTPKVPVTDWQLWNEVNSPNFWGPKPNPRQYVDLLRVTHDAIDSADPSARIILAGLFPTPRIRNGIFLSKYLPRLYKLGARGLFDAAALHPYATTPQGVITALRAVRQIMSRFKDGSKPIWITEVGWATGGARTPLTVTPRRQAAYLRKTYKLTAANRKRMHIAGVVWFSLQDLSTSIWFDHTGLFTASGQAKPSWKAFVSLTGGTP